ncbi:hypothetical protein HNQ36_000277 [Afipia massiliensis]|uniref:Uncharacterized protein n=1 Tax=Afipia massiliensis TaxID=211460 RepID=A0A840MPD6_9BRAD|nr:hypothetical protein [Afipia massiliensis]MBB5050329.1 hypothetical protein [Afipia massiliensis]
MAEFNATDANNPASHRNTSSFKEFLAQTGSLYCEPDSEMRPIFVPRRRTY